MDSLLAKAYCESDAAWDTYCKSPTQSTWQLYVDAKWHEHHLESQLKQRRSAAILQPLQYQTEPDGDIIWWA